MVNKKTEGVMAAIKNRGGFEKKGVSLLNIVEKLSSKREAAKQEKTEKEAKS